MSWSSAFIDAISAQMMHPIFVLEVTPVADEPCSDGYRAASHPAYGDPIITTVSAQGATLQPVEWTSTVGAFTIELAGDIGGLLDAMTRGTIVSLYVGFAGWALTDFERVAIAQVYQVSGGPSAWTLECRDILAALRQRIDSSTTGYYLFYGIGQVSTLTLSYNAGDTTLTVGSTSWYQRGSGWNGAIQITPDSGEPFILFWDNKTSATELSIADPTMNRHGTTQASAATSNNVANIALLTGHPMDIARKVLTSVQGASGNGAYDVLPSTWGLRIPEGWIDNSDIDRWKEMTNSGITSGLDWEVIVAEEQADPVGWLTSILSPAGIFLTMRQGGLTIRAAQGYNTSAAAVWESIEITDADFGTWSYEAWDSDHSTEYGNVRVLGATAEEFGTDENNATFPAKAYAYFDNSSLIFSNESDQCIGIAGRVYLSAQRIPERIEIVGRLYLAQLSPGGWIRFTSWRIKGRASNFRNGFTRAPGMILSVSPNWSGGTCTVVIVFYPSTGDAYP